MAQEALNNVLRHARAQHVTVNLRFGEDLTAWKSPTTAWASTSPAPPKPAGSACAACANVRSGWAQS